MKRQPCIVCAKLVWTRVASDTRCAKHRAKTPRRHPRIPRGGKSKKPATVLPQPKKTKRDGKKRR